MSKVVTAPNILLFIAIGILATIFLFQVVVYLVSSTSDPVPDPDASQLEQQKKQADNLVAENRRVANQQVLATTTGDATFPTRIVNYTIEDDDVTISTSSAFGTYYIISVKGSGKLILQLDSKPTVGQTFVLFMATPGTIGFESTTTSGAIVNSTNTVSDGVYGPLDDSLESGFVYTYMYLGTVSNPGTDPLSGTTSNVVSRYISVPNKSEDGV